MQALLENQKDTKVAKHNKDIAEVKRRYWLFLKSYSRLNIFHSEIKKLLQVIKKTLGETILYSLRVSIQHFEDELILRE